MPLSAFLEALQTLRALEVAAADDDPKAMAFIPWLAGWLAQSAGARTT